MIREKLSTQKSKSAIYKTAKYFNKEEGCVLFESNIYTPLNASKKEIAKAISQSIESDMADNKKGRKHSVRTQHDVVSFHTNDNITPEQARDVAKELYEATHKLSNRKYALGVHIDTNEVHVHIVWSIKDFDGKCYNIGNDYRKIERACDQLENKYGLIKPENRIATDIDRLEKHPDLKGKSESVKKRAVANAINKKYSEKLPPSNERMLDVRGIVSSKQQMKEALKPYFDNSSSPSDFINQITDNGYNIIHNKNSSFSIQYEDQIFKASELGLSYKTLKAKLGDDNDFEQTLKRKHNIKEYEDCSIGSAEAEPDYMKKVKPNSVLATKFKFIQHSEKVEYFYNSAKAKKAFEYHKDPSKVMFNDLSRQSAKAGIQRLVADAKPPQSFTVNGPAFFKKNVWLEFQLMGLESKGFKLEGYKPTPADLEELKKIQEHYASMNKKPEPKPEAATVAVEAPKPVEPVIVPPVMPTPVQNASETPAEPTQQVEQEKVAATNDALIDELMREFETTNPTPVAEAPTEAIEPLKPVEPIVSDLYTPMAPEPFSEPENHKVDGDYSTYSNDELVEEFEWLQPRLVKKLFTGNSKSDIAGHRYVDKQNLIYERTGEIKRQYELRQDLYKLFDEIKERDPAAAKQLEQAFKTQMANKRAVTFDLKPQLKK